MFHVLFMSRRKVYSFFFILSPGLLCSRFDNQKKCFYQHDCGKCGERDANPHKTTQMVSSANRLSPRHQQQQSPTLNERTDEWKNWKKISQTIFKWFNFNREQQGGWVLARITLDDVWFIIGVFVCAKRKYLRLQFHRKHISLTVNSDKMT